MSCTLSTLREDIESPDKILKNYEEVDEDFSYHPEAWEEEYKRRIHVC